MFHNVPICERQLWVICRKTQSEHNAAAVPQNADICIAARQISGGPRSPDGLPLRQEFSALPSHNCHGGGRSGTEKMGSSRLSMSQRAALRHVERAARRAEAVARARIAGLLARSACDPDKYAQALECVRTLARVVLHFHPDRF